MNHEKEHIVDFRIILGNKISKFSVKLIYEKPNIRLYCIQQIKIILFISLAMKELM